MTRHYLDHASSSPLRPEAARAIGEWLERGTFADPGRVYEEGRVVAAAIEEARDAVAALVRVSPRQVIFTSGGTESVNWANWAARQTSRVAPIACSAVEHSAVRFSAERHGPVTTIPVDILGRLDLDAVADLLADPAALPVLVNCQLANHEVGTVQPVGDVVERCGRRGVLVHVDASAAIGQMPVDLSELGADFVSISAHKFGGPAGVGALVVGPAARIPALLLGGNQERARRAGMEAVLPIIGFGAVAAALAAPGRLAETAARARNLTEELSEAARGVSGVVQYGDPVAARPAPRLLRRLGGRGRGRRARPRPGGRGGPLRVGVLLRGVRTLAGARRDGPRRRPLAPLFGRVVDSRGRRRGVHDVVPRGRRRPAIAGGLRATCREGEPARARARVSAPQRGEVGVDHHLDELDEVDLRLPAEGRVGLRRVTDEDVDLGRAQEPLVDGDVILPVQADPSRTPPRRARAPSASGPSRRRNRRAGPVAA